MPDDGLGGASDLTQRLQSELQIGVLAPRAQKALIKAVDAHQRFPPNERIGGHELSRLQAARHELMVGRRDRTQGGRWIARRRRHAHLAGCGDPARMREHRAQALSQPVGVGPGVVIGECDQRGLGRPPAGIARDSGSAARRRPQVAHWRRAGFRRQTLHDRAGAVFMAIVDHHDLKPVRREGLGHQRAQASLQQVGPPIGRHDNGDLRRAHAAIPQGGAAASRSSAASAMAAGWTRRRQSW